MEARSEQRVADCLTLQIPPDAGYIAMARMFAAAVARHFGCEEDAVEDLKVAVSEACTNSVKAHADARTNDPIELFACVRDEHVEFEIVDAGIGIDVERHLAVTEGVGTPPAGLYEGSLGLTLIRALFPDAEIARNSDRGTTVRFTLPTGIAELEEVPGRSPLD
ncbi:MAG: ATP-binding protein [Actinomycetota bacterium]